MADKIEEALIGLLAQVWRRVDWRRVARGRRPMDVFQHRVKVASYHENIMRMIEKLCHGLHLQSVDVPADLLTFLKENSDKALEILRNETVYYVVMAKDRAEGR